jgi:glycosyltransferase involved in cell wall biosynthesis
VSEAYAFLGRIEFGGRWSSRHHLAVRISEHSPVVYLEDPAPFPAGLCGRIRPAGGAVTSIRPLDFPLQRFGPIRRASVCSAARALRRALPADADTLVAVLYPGAPVAVAKALGADRIVYHALDDYSETYDGIPADRYLAWEAEALEAADIVVAITPPLAARLGETGHPRVETLPLGYDERLFVPSGRTMPPELADLPRPLIGFAGTVNITRLDIPLLTAAARKRPDLTFVFVGTEVGAMPEDLAALENVRVLGFMPRERMPDFVAAFDVVAAPYRDCRINRSCYPLKIVEALALGVPPVYTPPRDDLTELGPHVRYAGDAAGFLLAVDEALASGKVGRNPVRELGWDRLVVRFLEATR